MTYCGSDTKKQSLTITYSGFEPILGPKNSKEKQQETARKFKVCVSQRRNIDDFICDTYYEEEDDE